jgi:hypothetical protein
MERSQIGESIVSRVRNTYEKCVPATEVLSLIPRAETIHLNRSDELAQVFLEAQIKAGTDQGEKQKKSKERWKLQREAAKLLPNRRVSQCGRAIIDKMRNVTVFRSSDSGRAFFGNVKCCGSLWECPICAARITEKKRKDLREGLDAWRDFGGRVFLLTVTIPHYFGNDTRQLCDQLLAARKTMQNRKCWREFRKRIGLQGSVRALEVTYGKNGAHVHRHILLFCLPLEGTVSPCAADLLPSWQSACVSVGLPKPNEHGVDIRDGDYAASYVGKWGLDCELTKSHVKRGVQGGSTAWDLLRASADGNQEAGRKFQEHAEAFFNRRQLVWSKGLRKLLGLEAEKTDEELAQELTEAAVEIATIGRSDWRRVLRYDARATVLIVAEKDGSDGLRAFLHNLADFDSTRLRNQVWRN